MDIKVTKEAARVPVTVMHVSGNVDSSTYEAFQAKADELMKGGTRYLLVDLEQVPLITSAGLRALNTIFTRLRELTPDVSDEDMRHGINAGTYKSPHLKLLKPSKASTVALEHSGFSLFIESFSDAKEALASFG
jgi:anti-anti-sigma factor